MKILHVPFCYFPDPIGGTEAYVEALCKGLQAYGVELMTAAPGVKDDSYSQLEFCKF